MKKRVLLIPALLMLGACDANGSQFNETRPGLLGEKNLICTINVDTSNQHHDYTYGTVHCTEGSLP